ncbi:hypothetical protein C5167_012665 [Papaver somniferum]|uniref:Uncharacterized protein n=1 Tax=Papaver somniferum TaxID=3469 RepID=A0A4Y7J1I7_PAPSO|nr:hypothetical protein C5167_012665 [Papaver somniferum]
MILCKKKKEKIYIHGNNRLVSRPTYPTSSLQTSAPSEYGHASGGKSAARLEPMHCTIGTYGLVVSTQIHTNKNTTLLARQRCFLISWRLDCKRLNYVVDS